MREQDGRPVLLNRPSGVALTASESGDKLSLERSERTNGNNFGVYARRPGEVVIPGLPRR